jgi:hypothetical protein
LPDYPFTFFSFSLYIFISPRKRVPPLFIKR